MNVLALLETELKGKNWSLEEQIRYVYLRSCQLFSYDKRYDFCFLFDDGFQRQQQILNQKIDLEKVEDFHIVCSSWSREVFKMLLLELFQMNSKIIGEAHQYVLFSLNNKKIRADACLTFDLTRAKMGLRTIAYYPKSQLTEYEDELMEQDRKIEYIKNTYKKDWILKQKDQILEQSKECSESERKRYMLEEIKTMYQQIAAKKSIKDAEFGLEYLLYNILGEAEEKKIVRAYLCQDSNFSDWIYVNIYRVFMPDGIKYYKLEKQEKNYVLEEIKEEDAKEYVRSLKGVGREKILP